MLKTLTHWLKLCLSKRARLNAAAVRRYRNGMAVTRQQRYLAQRMTDEPGRPGGLDQIG